MRQSELDDQDLQPPAPGLLRATVSRTVTSADDPVQVELASTPDLDLPPAPWPARTDHTLPQRGDGCFVQLADDATPVVLAWDQPGW